MGLHRRPSQSGKPRQPLSLLRRRAPSLVLMSSSCLLLAHPLLTVVTNPDPLSRTLSDVPAIRPQSTNSILAATKTLLCPSTTPLGTATRLPSHPHFPPRVIQSSAVLPRSPGVSRSASLTQPATLPHVARALLRTICVYKRVAVLLLDDRETRFNAGEDTVLSPSAPTHP